MIDAVFEGVRDGHDRIVMTWPEPPGGGFVGACLALREARGTGRLAHATFGYWPWRDGATWAARLVLVNPSDIAAAARASINDTHATEWQRSDLAHGSLDMIEIRLRDLDQQMTASPGRLRSGASIVVRSPTLLETTLVFAPAASRAAPAYGPLPEQILRRVRRHTFLGERNAGLGDRFDRVGDPITTPFALLGLPPAKRAEELIRYIQSERARVFGIDVVIADLTRPGRSDLPDQWEPRLEALLKSLDEATGRRPATLILTEDSFTFRRATRVMKTIAATRRPKGRVYETGAYLHHRGLLGPTANLPSEMPPISFQADIKDASLAPLRDRLVVLGRALREDANAGASVVSRTLAFLRRAASLPIGLSEARQITDILYDADDEVDSNIQAMFRPKMALDLAFRQVTVEDHTPTGAQLAAAAGFKPAQQATVLHMLPNGELEDIRPDETVALGAGEERFIITVSDRLYRFTLDGERFDWPMRMITGPTVRKLGKVPAGKELLLERQDHPDRVIGDTDLVDLDGNAVESFVTRKPHWEINVQGVPVISDAPSIVVREAITQAGFDPDKGWFVFLKVQGQPKREVALADPIDLRMPGIERLRLTPRNVDNGEAPTPRRDFALLDADEDHLDRLGLRWETVLEGKRRWLLIHGYRMPSGYTVSNTELAIEVPPTYPQAALYGFYAYPPLARTSGGAIPSTQLRGTIRGREFHGWSRHRGASDPWNPAKDNIATHLALVDAALAKEVGA
ncbi:MAG: multiubiquitin domain-containing protein [Pseudomonadota bacterium]